MTAQDIAKLIKEPGHSGQIAPEALSALAAKYPYTQIFSLLYLQSLGKRNDLRFDEELMKHSYRITDRARLYRLIHDFQGDTVPSTLPETTIEEKAAAPVDNVLTQTHDEQAEIQPNVSERALEYLGEEALESPAVHEKSEITNEEEQAPQSGLAESESDKLEDEKRPSEESAGEIQSDIETETEETTADPLDQLILHYAATASYRLEDLTPEEIEEMERRKREKESQDVSSHVPAETLPPRMDIEPKQSFTSWFSINRNAQPDSKEEQKAVRSLVSDFQSADPTEELFGEVEKPKQEFFSPARKAKESLREDDLPVSETLAKIYAMQGNYPKAIRAYEQLSLIYPEKKTFFATLIADLEQKLNLK